MIRSHIFLSISSRFWFWLPFRIQPDLFIGISDGYGMNVSSPYFFRNLTTDSPMDFAKKFLQEFVDEFYQDFLNVPSDITSGILLKISQGSPQCISTVPVTICGFHYNFLQDFNSHLPQGCNSYVRKYFFQVFLRNSCKHFSKNFLIFFYTFFLWFLHKFTWYGFHKHPKDTF